MTRLPACPLIASFLSVSTLASPLFTEDLYSYMRRGALKVVGLGPPDKMPSICKQLLLGLGRLHELQILHRDVKPLNMLVHVSAVGDEEQTRAVLADLGGAIRMSARVGSAAFPLDAQGTEPTTYQYRAPERGRGRTSLEHVAMVTPSLATGQGALEPSVCNKRQERSCTSRPAERGRARNRRQRRFVGRWQHNDPSHQESLRWLLASQGRCYHFGRVVGCIWRQVHRLRVDVLVPQCDQAGQETPSLLGFTGRARCST